MAQAASSTGIAAIRGALLLVLLVGALVSTSEATRSVAAAPAGSVHPSSFLGCIVGCGTQVTMCGVSCLNKPLIEAPECGFVCGENNAKCMLACGLPAQGPTPPQA